MRHVVALVLCAATAALLGGCLKINLTVQLNEDGTGQVIEKMTYGEKLVNIARQIKNLPQLSELTGEKAARDRAAQMGKQVRFVRNAVTTQPDGSTTVTNTYTFDDIEGLRLAPMVWGANWNQSALKFHLDTSNSIKQLYSLRIDMERPARSEKSTSPLLEGRDAQQVRTLMPIFNDLVEGFELTLKLEVYKREQWASWTRGHPATGGGTDVTNRLPTGGGRLVLYQVTDRQLQGNEDALLMILPWLHTGRDGDLMRLLPYIHATYGGYDFFRMDWRAIQCAHGREYY